MHPRSPLISSLLSLALLSPAAFAGTTDLQYPPSASSGGHDFNHAPIGQSFIARAAKIKAGIYLSDAQSFQSAFAPTASPYPYAVASTLTVTARLLVGEGSQGTVLDSRTLTLNAPFGGYVEFDYAAAGIVLSVGSPYTLLLTDASGQAYPNGVTGWIVPSVNDFSSGATSPPGAYLDGHPILQNVVVINDAGIGDNAFEVIDLAPGTTTPPPPPPPPPPATCSGTYASITTLAKTFIEVNGGPPSQGGPPNGERVYYAPQSATTFTGGTTTFVARELVSYTGTADLAGCHASSMTVYPIPTAVVVNGTLPAGQVGSAYSTTLTATGGIAPYSWGASGIPAGLAFADGRLSGTPTVAGPYTLIVDTSDAIGQLARNQYDLTVAAAPAPTCGSSGGSRSIDGSGRITAVSSTGVTIGLQRLALTSCTSIRQKGGASATLRVGQVVEWRASVRNGVTSATSIVIQR